MADKTKFTTADEYIASFPKEVQQVLQQIRQTTHKAAPDAKSKSKKNRPISAGFVSIHPPAPAS